MRYAIYFTPRQDEPLARIAANWLGRDPFGAATRAGRGGCVNCRRRKSPSTPPRRGATASMRR